MKKILVFTAIVLLCATSYGLDAGLNVRVSSMSTNAVGTTNFITQATDGYLKAFAVNNPSNATVTIVITTSADTTLGVARTLLSVTNAASAIYYPVIADTDYLGASVASFGSQVLCRDTFSIVTGAASIPSCPLKITFITDRVD